MIDLADLVTVPVIAEMSGLARSTVRQYYWDTERDTVRSTPVRLPPPLATFEDIPVWSRFAILDWIDEREAYFAASPQERRRIRTEILQRLSPTHPVFS